MKPKPKDAPYDNIAGDMSLPRGAVPADDWWLGGDERVPLQPDDPELHEPPPGPIVERLRRSGPKIKLPRKLTTKNAQLKRFL